jgi:hypothetical protein
MNILLEKSTDGFPYDHGEGEGGPKRTTYELSGEKRWTGSLGWNEWNSYNYRPKTKDVNGVKTAVTGSAKHCAEYLEKITGKKIAITKDEKEIPGYITNEKGDEYLVVPADIMENYFDELYHH